MQYLAFFPSVAFEKRQINLRQYLPRHFLRDKLFRFFASFYKCGHVTLFAKFHDDKDLAAVFVYYAVVVPHNIRMFQVSEYVDFGNQLLLLFLRHPPIIHLFPNEDAAVRFSFDFTDGGEGPLSDV